MRIARPVIARAFQVLWVAGVLAGALTCSARPAVAQDAPELNARAWVLVDVADGEVLETRRKAKSYPIASATKLMTAYVARRELRLAEEVVAPAYVAAAAESLLGLEEGERIEVRDLLYGLVLASGNDAAVALAEAAAGSLDAFVRKMNSGARRLGLDDSSFSNPIGLDEPGNFSSAADLVELTLELRRDRVFRRIFDAPSATLRSGARARTVVNRNTLVRSVPFVTGVKTGYTIGAGYVLVGSAARDGVSLVSTVLGAPSEAARDAETLELLEYGFSLYRERQPVRARERLAAPELHDQSEALPLVAARGVRLTVRRDQRVDTRVRAPEEVEGPIERGERLGEVVVTVDGERAASVPLAAARAAPAASLLERFDGSVPGPRAVAWIVAIAGLGALFIAALVVFDRRRSRR
ncbi:MAG: D-alanyl-D-alanine carboxypeptidase family protein [Solirubrobacterales bacterium]